MHTGQRNLLRVRVSNDAFEKGLRMKDFGEVLYHMIMDEFDAVVDKCQITLITDPAETKKLLEEQASSGGAEKKQETAGIHASAASVAIAAQIGVTEKTVPVERV